MLRLTRVLLVVTVAVGLIGLSPGLTHARTHEEAYAGGGVGSLAAKHRAERHRTSSKLAPARRHRAVPRHRREARHETRRSTSRTGRSAALRAGRRVTQRREFEQAPRALDPPSLDFVPDPTFRTAPNNAYLDGQGASTGTASGGASDLFNGPPTSTSIDNLGEGRGPRIVVPLFKLLNELSGPPPSQ